MTAILPDPAPELELPRVLGGWYVLFSNRRGYRQRSHPHVEYALLEQGDDWAQLRTSLRYRSADLLGRIQRRIAVGTAIAEEQLGQYKLRGHGLARMHSGRFCFALVGPNYRWTAIWHGRSASGAAPGLDICTRDPSIPQAQLDAILAAIRGHTFLGSADRPGRALRCAGLVATAQDYIPPTPYRLE